MTKGKRGSKPNRPSRASAQSRQPPPLVTSFRGRNRVRWVTTGALPAGAVVAGATYPIAYKEIADILCVGDSTNITAWRIANDAIRVRRVSIWGAPAATGSTTTVSVDFSSISSGSTGSADRHTDTQLGTAFPAFVQVKPKKSSQASQWQPAGSTNTAFGIQCPSGSVIELDYDWVNTEQATGAAVTNATVAAVAGASYMRGLDGVAIAGSSFQTIGFSQI